MRYIQRLNKDVNKGNEISKAKQRCTKANEAIYQQRLNKDVNKGNEIYYKGYTKM